MSENDKISLIIKTTVNTDTYNLNISKNSSIKDLKNEIEKLTNIPAGAQKIIHKGKNLKDSETIESYNIKNNDSIVVIRNRNYNPNGARNTNLLGAFPQVNPAVLSLLTNPNFMNIPELQQIIFRNRDNQSRGQQNRIGIIRNFPNNQFMQNLIGRIPNNVRADENLIGKSFPEIGNKFTEYMQNRNNNENNNNNNDNNNNNNNNNNNPQFIPQNLFNLFRPPQPPSNLNIRIPFQPNSQENDNNNSNNQNTQNENVNYREIYKEQLAQLKDMGFTDESKNIEILKNCQGNINFAIEKLFGGGA